MTKENVDWFSWSGYGFSSLDNDLNEMGEGDAFN